VTRTIGVAIAIPEPYGGSLQAYRERFGDPLAHAIPTHVTLLPPTTVKAERLPDIEEHLRLAAEAERGFEIHLRCPGPPWATPSPRPPSGIRPGRPGYAEDMKVSSAARVTVAAVKRYKADQGDRQAAAVTYFAFLAFFPLVALAFAVLGYVVDADSSARETVARELSSYLPGLIGSGPNQVDLDQIAAAKTGVGIFGLVGLLVAGLGWVDALRGAVRHMWRLPEEKVNFLVRKVRDVAILVGLGLMILGGIAATSVTTAVTSQLLEAVGLDGSVAAAVLVRVVAVLLALALNTVVILYVFLGLAGAPARWRQVLPGAVVGAVGVEVLKLLGTFLVSRTTGNPLYGTFAVVVGLLVWLDLVGRFVLFVAALTAERVSAQAAAAEQVSEPEPATVPGRRRPQRPPSARPARWGSTAGATALGALLAGLVATWASALRAVRSVLRPG
jgi:membrane protein